MATKKKPAADAKPKPKRKPKEPAAIVSLAQRTRATGRGGRGR